VGGWIPWTDIERIGIFKLNIKLVGIRLSRYDHFLVSLTPAEMQTIESRLRNLKMFAGGAAFVKGAEFDPKELQSYVDLLKDQKELYELGEMAYAKDLASAAGMLKWNREHYGFEWGFSSLELDRSLDQFANLLEQYRQAAIS
jgi:hypothetical protein